MTITKRVAAAMALVIAFEGAAAAQAMFTASIGNVFGGDAPSKKSTWAIAIGGGGAHGIGSELEFSQTANFFETGGVAHGKIVTLMPSVFFVVPAAAIRPYGIFGFGFIRQRTGSETDGLLSGLSDRDIGYSIGGGMTFQFARHAGIRGDFRHFQVRTADGINFNRFTVGLVLGG